MSIIYVLKLEKNKFYIGKSGNPDYRIEQHKSGKGSAWTRNYKVLEEIERVEGDDFMELALTLTYMKKYGIENVRGADYVQVVLSRENIEEIKRHIAHDSGECFSCGKKGHYIGECTGGTKGNRTGFITGFIPRFITGIFRSFSCCRREKNQAINPVINQDDNRIITFGKHKNKSYIEVWENDKGYCRWIISEEKGRGRDFLEFQKWCREN